MFRKKIIIPISVLLISMPSFAGDFGDIFVRVLGEVVFRSLFHSTFHSSWGNNNFGHDNTGSTAEYTRKQRPRLLTDQGKKVNFFFEVKFVLNKDEVKDCKLQKTVYHRSYFPYFIDYPKKEYMDLWYNNQSIKELSKKHLANVVLIKGQTKNPIRVKQEADLYSCPKLKPLQLNKCKWIRSEKMKIDDRSHLAKRQATVKMMNKAAAVKRNHIAFVNRTGKSSMGMQKFSYEVFNCPKL